MRARRALAVRESDASEGSEDEDSSRPRSGSNRISNASVALVSDKPYWRPIVWCAIVSLGMLLGAMAWVQQTSKVASWPVLRRGLIGLYYTFPVFARSVDEPNAGVALSTLTTTASPTSSGSTSSSESAAATAGSSRCYARPLLPWPLKGDEHGQADVNSNGEETDDWHVPLAEAPIRCLPNFLFIGTSKSGTSSLRSHLVAHPGIRFVRRMQTGAEGAEVHRFDRWDYSYALSLVEKALEWGHSPPVRDASVPVVHYTPHYLFAPAVPQHIAEFYPHSQALKFIILLRDPTTRAVSSYWFKQPNQRGGSPDHFHVTMAKEVAQRRRYEAYLARAMWGNEMAKDWGSTQSEKWVQEAKEWAMAPVLTSSLEDSTGAGTRARDTKRSSPRTGVGSGISRHSLTVESTNASDAAPSSSSSSFESKVQQQLRKRHLSAEFLTLAERQPWAPESWARLKSHNDDLGSGGISSNSNGGSTCSAGSHPNGFLKWLGWNKQPRRSAAMRAAIEDCCSALVRTESLQDGKWTWPSFPPLSPRDSLFTTSTGATTAATAPHLRTHQDGNNSISIQSGSHSFTGGGGADMHEHLAKGIYVEQLDRWFGYFSPQQFKVLTTESMKRDGGMAAYQEMCEFLGVPAFGSQLAFPDEIVLRAQLARRFNEGSNPDTQPVYPRSLALLRRFYAPYITSLQHLLLRTFLEWN